MVAIGARYGRGATMRAAMLCALTLTLLGCGDEANGSSAAGTMSASGIAGDGATSTAGFDVTVGPLIEKACNCHQSAPILMAPFSLKPGEAYDNLVGVPAMQLPSMSLVTPGSLNDSYLWHKLNDTQLEVGGSGLQMPSTLPLEQADIDIFGRWIAAGAPR